MPLDRDTLRLWFSGFSAGDFQGCKHVVGARQHLLFLFFLTNNDTTARLHVKTQEANYLVIIPPNM